MASSKPLLVGINGEIGCGKSTATNWLAVNYNTTEYMFAKPLKDIAVLLGFEPRQAFGTQEEKLEINDFWNISCRQFLQVFGSEVCRDFVPKALPNMNFNGVTMWVRLFEKFYRDNKDKNIVVSDVRFEDESKKIKELGGYVIRIERPKMLESSNGSLTHLQHKSELQADRIAPQIVIRNNGSLDYLYEKLRQAVEYIKMGMLNVPGTVVYM
jgi:hypothetical protein